MIRRPRFKSHFRVETVKPDLVLLLFETDCFALKGVTVCFSSGDDGDGSAPGKNPCVHFPASSPHVLSWGGTHMEASVNRVRETVWNETLPGFLFRSGGGFSNTFERPDWQSDVKVGDKSDAGRRGVPDVAGKADIATGYGILVGEVEIPMGGTSAAAPLWASLIARINEQLGTPVGYLTPLLYGDRFRKATQDITGGNNGVFHAAPGWDPCTGWGTPDGKELLAALTPRIGESIPSHQRKLSSAISVSLW